MLRVALRFFHFTVATVVVTATESWPQCVEGFDLRGGDLEGGHVPASPGGTPKDCEALCEANANCSGYSYHKPDPCTDHGEHCPWSIGCCRLKNAGDMNPTGDAGMHPNNNKCSCSALLRVPPQARPLPPVPTKGEGLRNVLYVLFDDLRPELPGAFGHDFVHAPNFQRLTSSGTVFRRAYCQIAVCSPSRMSFLTGRRPTTTRTMNFLDHFRQADCGINRPNTTVRGAGKPIATGKQTSNQGGSGQCCTTCTFNKACTHWAFHNGECELFNAGTSRAEFAPLAGAVSGVSGALRSWTSLPEAFKKGGWLTMGTGKAFHTEEGGIGPTADLKGIGMPPNQDPPSWTSGLSMSQVNEVAPMDDSAHQCQVKIDSSSCPVDAQLDGTLNKNKSSENDGEFEDKIIANDGILKLRLAAHERKQTGRPFMLTVGFRKPHLCFRFPEPFLQHYPGLAEVPIAKHPALDPSIPPIAHQDTSWGAYGPGQEPWKPMNEEGARRFRLYYAATISWVDSQLGRLLDELDSLGLANDTVVAMHSDHGWSLGEQGEWQKFTNFELGTRVPLVIREPGRPAAVSDAIVELVDVMPTLMGLAGVPNSTLDKDAPIDGTSLQPLLGGGTSVGRVGLSMYPRCPNGNRPDADPQQWWKQNSCLKTDRTLYSFMGLSLRTEQWRYTEWRWWDGAKEQPAWEKEAVGIELYDHLMDDGTDFDAFENINLAHNKSHAATVQVMAALLRKYYDNAVRHEALVV